MQHNTEARTENLRRELVAARLTAECWDSMLVHPRQVRAMQRSGVAAENFAIRK
jgi:siderophore synthetase component